MAPRAKQADPLDTLAVGLAADHAAGKAAAATDKVEAAVIDAATETAKDGSADDVAAATIDAAHEARNDELANEVPVAPGDDREAVFARRLERLTNMVEDAKFESGTIFGDLRDLVVDLFKHRPAVWSAMPSSEQQDLVRHVEKVVKVALRKVVLVVAEDESKTIQGTFLGNYAVKGETIEAKLKIDGVNGDVLMDVYNLAGHRVVIVSADDQRFAGARRDVPIMADQIPLGFADEKPKPADPAPIEPPADDSDPADGADDLFRVYDGAEIVWLDKLKDGWTPHVDEAGAWPKDEAEALAGEHEAEIQAVGADNDED